MRVNLNRLTKINWDVKLHDPLFYIQMIISFSLPIAAYLGIKATDITTWKALFDNILNALNNPYCTGIGIISAVNALIDSECIEDEMTVEEEVVDEKIEE